MHASFECLPLQAPAGRHPDGCESWKRHRRRRLANAKSLLRSSRACRFGLLGHSTMPSHLPPFTGATKAGPLPSSRFHGLHRYYEPLGLPPGTTPFHLRLIGVAFARRGPPGRASPVPRRTFSACSPPYPGGVHRPLPVPDGVCCLRRDMNGSATPPFGAYLTRLQGSLDAGPADLLPSHAPHTRNAKAFDIPLSRGDLAPRPGSAARRTGACRDGTLTRWLDEASIPRLESFRTQHDQIVDQVSDQVNRSVRPPIRLARAGRPAA